ncbi:MAG TPA: replicative DNA helicase [Candidatus Sulfotelmatobacter sp.]|nr:replicative DNA helicase [Candidatus Sulfotelmatobacter sp.]
MNVAPISSAIDRIPPNNLEAEMALLGSILVDKEMMAAVSEIVQPSDFYASLHESIYLALYALYERGEPLDKVALAEELRGRGMLDKVGGLAYLGSLMDTVPTAASAEYYARIVREKSALRSLIHAGTQITSLGYESEHDVPAAIDQAEQTVYEVGNRSAHNQFASVPSLLLGVFQSLEQRHEQKGDRTGVTSGFRDIDDYTAGWQPGNLVILAARPAMGKTSLALNMAVAAAKDERKPVAVFSLEMTKQELVERLLSSEAKLDASKLRRGAIADRDWEKIGNAMGVLHELPIYLDDAGSVTVTEIRSRLRRLKSAHGLSVVFIDYLQLVRPAMLAKQVNRNEELSEICRTLKATAKDLEIPIVALAQLNRAVETRADKRPMLSDLRDCLAGDALVINAETGERIPIAEIVERDLRFDVWAVDERTLRLQTRPIEHAWRVNEQKVFRVVTRGGRTIRCTAGHKFLTFDGWQRLDRLTYGSSIAVPAHYPSPVILGASVQRGAAGYAPPMASVDPEALRLGDVLWEPIVSIEAEGVEPVYDLTVGDLHNFCVDDVVTHNSGAIEQEADIVTFLYRDVYYNKETSPEPDATELIIAKHRNGKVGTVKLRFQPEHTLFVPYGDESHYSGP